MHGQERALKKLQPLDQPSHNKAYKNGDKISGVITYHCVFKISTGSRTIDDRGK